MKTEAPLSLTDSRKRLLLPNGALIDAELTDGDINVIEKYVSEMNDGLYLEIGTKHGGSTWVARNATKGEVYAIDPFFKLEAWEGETYDINFINKTSIEAARDWDKLINVLFIDGDHQQAQQDFGAWEKFIVKGGVVLFHDHMPHSPKVISDCLWGPLRMREYAALYVPESDNKEDTSILQIRKL